MLYVVQILFISQGLLQLILCILIVNRYGILESCGIKKVGKSMEFDASEEFEPCLCMILFMLCTDFICFL